MAVRKGELHLPSLRGLIELGPAVEDRMALEARPRAHTVEFYALTRGAERALCEISAQARQPSGAFFWIGGAPGTGKTHFLSYLLGLESKGGVSTEGEKLILGLELAGRPRAENLERQILEMLIHELALNAGDAMLWRRMNGAEALEVALDHARRSAVRAVTMAIDFGASEPESAFGYLATVAQVCGATKQPRFSVIAAGRGRVPSELRAFDVGPADQDELVAIAIRRARSLKEGEERVVDDFYRGVSLGTFEPATIFPFHPVSVETLRALANPPGTIADTARLARVALAASGEGRAGSLHRLITAADLLHSPAIRARLEERLGESGREALKIARAAADSLAERAAARQIVDTLVLAHFAEGSAALKIGDLEARLPRENDRTAPRHRETLLEALAERSRGVICCESGAARFDPRAARAPELAAFNQAIELIRRFDPTIAPARDAEELKDGMKRLADAMADALETVHRAEETLAPITGDERKRLGGEREAALSHLIALASGGPALLLAAAADAALRDEAMKALTAYEALSRAAAARPRIVSMREYLRGTGLKWNVAPDAAKDPRVAEMESTCALLESQLDPARASGSEQNFEALYARVQAFRWQYAQEYSAAHEIRRKEMQQLAPILEDARRHLEALARLNAIAALGAPEGKGLDSAVARIGTQIVQCEVEGPLILQMTPRCPQCGFVLGTPSPAPELNELFEKIRAALRSKLAALSKNAVARLIREHDRARRLEGFLRITQAAQTEALVKVLDDSLAGYLARLIDENIAAAERQGKETMGAPVHAIASARLKTSRTGPAVQPGRSTKAPR